jgi:hypothetical protein
MNRWKYAFLGVALALVMPAQADPPDGWRIAGSSPTDYEFGVDTQVAYAGSRSSGFIKSKVEHPLGFGTLMQRFTAINYRGSRMRLSGYLKTDQAQRGQMWLRIDGPGNEVLGFDNMDSRPITGSSGWKRYEVVLDVPQTATNIAFGFFLWGSGTVWADEFKLERVDASVAVTAPDNGARYDGPRNLNFEQHLPAAAAKTTN